MARKVTMTQIANELGVSRSLVSYALMDKYGVSEEMKRRIITKAIEMGYFKTPHASMKSGKNIAVIIDEEYLCKDGFFTRIVAGIENSSVGKKYMAKILSPRNGEEMDQFVTRLVDLKPAGVIVIRQLEKELTEGLKKLNLPKVFVDLIDPNPDCFEVRVNNYGNMHMLTRHLIKNGHRDFSFVGDPDWALSFEERYRGFVKACEESGATHTDITVKSQNGFGFNTEACKNFIHSRSGVTMVCANDSIAAVVYEIAASEGKRIPEDISVTGFDDVAESPRLSPPLTTMHIPRFELGRVAFELLHEQVCYSGAQSRVVCLNANLVERTSVQNKNEMECVR